jgi:hypothetical protein
MPTLVEQIAANVAYLHARRVYQRFLLTAQNVQREQTRALHRALHVVAGSDFARRHALASVQTPAELRQAVPLAGYESFRPYIDRVWAGDPGALFRRAEPILMFATSSGTTSKPKLIPVTRQFVSDYRRGWNVFGLKVLTDHPAAVLRPILQSSSRHDGHLSPTGLPCGAITGLLAKMQKRIVRRFYVGSPDVAHIPDARARYYTLMRLGVTRDVSFAITANPATLIQMARTAAAESEELIRDVHDGTLSSRLVPDAALRRRLSSGLKPDRTRAEELRRLRSTFTTLRPREYWNLTFLACWTGGSLAYYLNTLREWYGEIPIRDIGLLASEGRVTIPFEDGAPLGALDVTAAFFEFIPVENCERDQPPTLLAQELETGRDYALVLTNTAGLVRYRLDDVVRVHGRLGQTPLLEFLYRAGRVASIAGEKLTENHVAEAIRNVCHAFNLPDIDFVLAPCWGDPPYYRMSCEVEPRDGLVEALDRELCLQNEEYASRRNSMRLGSLQLRLLEPGSLAAMDHRLMQARGATSEQYKRVYLFTQPADDDTALADTRHEPAAN